MPRMSITKVPEFASDGGLLVWSILVPMGKNVVYRYELFPGGRALVYKSPTAPEPAYEIIDGICSCPAAYHSKECKHIRPLSRVSSRG